MATAQTVKVSKNKSAQWTSLNPILADKEIGVEVDTELFKVGNGVTPWRGLGYTASGGVNARFVFLSNDPDNMLGMTTDGGIFLDKKAFNGLAAYTAGKEQGSAATTPPDEYNATMLRVGRDMHDILAAIVTITNRMNDLEGRPAGNQIDDTVTALTTTWSSFKTNDQILAKIVELKADITSNPNGAYDALTRLAQLLEDNDSMAVTITEELASTVRFSVDQTLTEAHKAQARKNIGAAGTTELGDSSGFLQTYIDATATATGSPFEQSEI